MAMKPVKVSQLNGYIKRILQSDPLLGNVSVVGEISNLKLHSTGHVYFTLKDESSKVNCFLGAEYVKDIRYELADGMEIVVNGYIYLYERGGTYSLNVREITVEGIGNLSAAFERLKEKLSKEGLFDEKYKKPIPFFPAKVAVITSETGAAVKDIIKIIKSRNNIVDVVIYPCLVQGPGAAGDISRAIREVNRLFPEVDTIILGRGGGSLEELWAFNEEIVARSIFDSKIPVISAVGHETDFTISDFVADKRAETPTAAAQMAVPDINALKEYCRQKGNQLQHTMERFIKYMELRVTNYNIEHLQMSLKNRLHIQLSKIEGVRKDIDICLRNKMTELERNTEKCKSDLEAFHPVNIMKRGYAAILDQDGKLTGSAEHFATGDKLTAVLQDGVLECEVFEIRREQYGKTESKNEL
ncbi:exodeoxyribonuclease VII large subunit [Sinanaerobacter chloroacetimidivorans]|uniref:Exodeoxyribonuclease 7 large subunit n=1 Tax=Sinanaerobacter chloroacetimidivorans TaxID=2818044 RepID=A0A8J8B1U9_9FIRM|nr:exodeoxyribonuclease VII large subunit [Sinanaerobacter chloroacetimidivorans]MBR0596620.1 exodeoxyribonuclease VII large subunit [Sinanaerobacter chloroacetimidivorans]